MDNSTKVLNKITENVEKAIVGKRHVIENVLIALLSKGHVLIEDIPGVGKTSLVAAFARSVDCSFSRIQFTPDVTPSDITGFSIYNRKTNEFEYRKGAVFCQFLLADEINRTFSKTQSSLLEVMEEKQVTVDSVTYSLPNPFMVFATQNPIEYVGTFALPEAQLDRFFIKIELGYPEHKEEIDIININSLGNPAKELEAVVTPEEIIELQNLASKVFIDEKISDFIVTLIERTRNHHHLTLGASPRASINLAKAAKSHAFLHSRNYVVPDDVIKMAKPVVAHRLILNQEAKFQDISTEEIIDGILEGIDIGAI